MQAYQVEANFSIFVVQLHLVIVFLPPALGMRDGSEVSG